MKYTVVVPVYNEENNLQELLKQVSSALRDVKGGSEIVVVDDGSNDDTLLILEKLKKRYKYLKVFSYRKNRGKSTALLVGFNNARGNVIITIDADLQDDPKDIRKLLAKLHEGYGAVSGWRKTRRDNLTKKASSMLFNYLVSKTTGLTLHDFNCGLKVFKKEALDEINLSSGNHRFIPLLVHWRGHKVTEVPVRHRERYRGESKYGKFGLERALKSFFDLATLIFLNKYAKRPMRLFGVLGLFFSLIGFLIGLYMVYLRLVGEVIGDRPLLILAVLLMVLGVQLFSLGLLGEMLVLKAQLELPKYSEIE